MISKTYIIICIFMINLKEFKHVSNVKNGERERETPV